MSLKNLEARYKERTRQLYAAATLKFDGGKASRGANDDPLIVRKPGDGYFGVASRLLGRSLPVSSALQDVKRITLFTVSIRGLAFLAKQQLLQTGNTFEQTRLINPLFAIGAAAAPGLGNIIRIRRHLRPITGGSNSPGGGILSKTDTSYNNVRKLGQLQVGTYKDLTEKAGGNPVIGFLKKVAGPITSTISAFTAKKNVGEEFGGWDENSWKQSRPELGKTSEDYIISVMSNSSARFRFGGVVSPDNGTGAITFYKVLEDGTYITYLKTSDGSETTPRFFQGGYSDYRLSSPTLPSRGTGRTYEPITQNPVDASSKNFRSDLLTIPTQIEQYEGSPHLIQQLRNQQVKYTINTPLEEGDTRKYLKYFEAGKYAVAGEVQFDDNVNSKDTYVLSQNAAEIANSQRTAGNKKISYIKDTSNQLKYNHSNRLSPYVSLPGKDKDNNWEIDDPIIVSFRMSTDDPVQFRAFISDLSQTVSPEYKTYQYVGRIEKFVNYTTVQRKLSFKLDILAFSKDELEGVWTRVNYLTALAFPYSINRGILQPNIVKLTIGNLFVDQPGYITALTTDFKEQSWELDNGKQVPHGMSANIEFTIIEKTAATAATAFYGIMEGINGEPTTPPQTTEPEVPQFNNVDELVIEETVVESRTPPIPSWQTDNRQRSDGVPILLPGGGIGFI
jgi:hypothetical protein